MATKKTPKKPAKRIDLHQTIREAIVKACSEDRTRSCYALADIYRAVSMSLFRLSWTVIRANAPIVARALEQEVRDLIASGQIVKVKGVYRRGYIGGPGGEELPEPPKVQTEADAFSRTAPMTEAEAKVAKMGRR